MSFRQVLGRCLLVTICIITGINIFVNTITFERKLVDSYSKIHKIMIDNGVTVPLHPIHVAGHSYEIVSFTAFLLIIGSTLVIFNFRLGNLIISSLLFTYSAIIHNPVLFTNENDLIVNIHIILLDFFIIAGLLISCDKKKNKVKVE